MVCFDRALRLDAHNAEAMLYKGIVLMDTGRPQDAIGVLRQVTRIRADGDTKSAHLLLAMAYQRCRKVDSAIDVVFDQTPNVVHSSTRYCDATRNIWRHSSRGATCSLKANGGRRRAAISCLSWTRPRAAAQHSSDWQNARSIWADLKMPSWRIRRPEPPFPASPRTV